MENKDMDYKTAFFYARTGEFDELEKMIRDGFDINTENTVGQNILTEMFYEQFKTRENAILKLIELGIDVNFVDCSNKTALYYASIANMSKVVQRLLEQKANPTLGENALPYFLGEDKSVLRKSLLKSPLLTQQQKDWLQKNQYEEMKLMPVNIKFAKSSHHNSFIFSKKVGFLENVWCTSVGFNINDNQFYLSLVRKNNEWIPYSLAHKYNEKNNSIYCPYCKKQNASSVNCEEALPFLDQLFCDVLEQTGGYFS